MLLRLVMLDLPYAKYFFPTKLQSVMVARKRSRTPRKTSMKRRSRSVKQQRGGGPQHERTVSVLQESDLRRMGIYPPAQQTGGGILQKIFPFFYKEKTQERERPQARHRPEMRPPSRLIREETLPRNFRSQTARAYDDM